MSTLEIKIDCEADKGQKYPIRNKTYVYHVMSKVKNQKFDTQNLYIC